MPIDVSDSPDALLRRAEELVRERRAPVVEDLLVGLAWADRHGEEPPTSAPGGDRLLQLGGDGTPAVRELAVPELAIARATTTAATRAALADALDLRHRLPLLWAAVRALEIEPWVARKVAARSRRLSKAVVGVVDQAVSDARHESPSRLLAIAEAKVIEADTVLHAAQLAEKARERGVWIGRPRADGPDASGEVLATRSVYAKVSPETAYWVDELVDRTADVLARTPEVRAEHHPELADDATRDELRAAAFGWLARPAALLDLLGALGADDAPARPRPRARVYVHLHESTLLSGDGVARVEGLGPMLASHLARLVGHTDIELAPVIDLAEIRSVNSYEHPEHLKERTRLRLAASDVFPHATAVGRRVDHDHPVPYDPGGPPGQTSDLNVAPLTRGSHRAKTHLAYRVEQLGLGRYLWTTPHGLVRLVDATGTHTVSAQEAALLRAAHGRRGAA
ncbi:hypothetical protein AB3X52_03140 [Nocardioides sp. DS6]|uniref:DUF222 domain-containing protein n=1 Tax=Nocardioides eburneus TaxID=3231482 RepID=A0ABV3SUJ1_9ACTN